MDCAKLVWYNMCMKSILKKLKIWGIKGVWDFLLRKLDDRRLRKFLAENARRFPLSPQEGITLLADMTDQSSLSKVMRDLAFALRRAGLPFQAFDLHPRHHVPSADADGILTPPDKFRLLKYDNIIEMYSSPLPKGLPIRRSRVVFWEFTTGLLEYFPSVFDNVSTIVAMSDFNCESFRMMTQNRVDVRKVLYPFFFDDAPVPDKSTTRVKYGIPKDAFVVFFNFSYDSSFNRKNPEGSVRAFAKAFSTDGNACLVFKTKGAEQHRLEREKLLSLANSLNIGKQIVMIDDYIPQHDIYGLTNACDVYLSLHRGEGFGLGIAEAMSLAKPVVATDYSSTTEFCRPETSIPVPYSIVKVPDDMHDNPCYSAVKEWAEPDIEAAAAALLRLRNDPVLRERMGLSAKTFMASHFSIDSFRESIKAFLQ